MRFLLFDGTDIMFNIVPIFIGIIFIFIIGTIIVSAVKGGKQWKKNNQSPVLTVPATVVTKHVNVSNHHTHSGVNNSTHMSSTTTYYATFQVESGDRIQFKVSNAEFGMLVEKDRGKLTFQGTRYKGFERQR